MNEVLSKAELIAAIDAVLALSISDSTSNDLRAYKKQIEDGTILIDDNKYVVDLCRRLSRQGPANLRTPDILRAPTKHRRRNSMPHPRRRRHGPKPDRRRALEWLAGSRDGLTEALMLAHGFRVELLVDLCIAGLATATPERTVAGGRRVEVVRLKITDAGRQALTGKGTQ